MSNPNPKSGFKANPQNINKDGRPKKGYSITEWFQEMLNSDPEIKNELGLAILAKAKQGDPTALKLVWNYMDGMPKQSSDITSNGETIKGNVIIFQDFKNETDS